MAEVGSVVAGSKKMYIRAFTGDVVSLSRNSDTETTSEFRNP